MAPARSTVRLRSNLELWLQIRLERLERHRARCPRLCTCITRGHWKCTFYPQKQGGISIRVLLLAHLNYYRRRSCSSLTAWEALSSKRYVMHRSQPHLLTSPKTYLLAREDPAQKDLTSRIHTLYFLATPHRGSNLAKTLTRVLKVSYGQKAFVTGLVPNSSLIHSINISFRHYVEDLQLWSFYETFPSNLIYKNALIVDESSGTLGYAKEHICPLNADHRGICKFDLPSDPNYKTLRNAFVTTIDGITSQST